MHRVFSADGFMGSSPFFLFFIKTCFLEQDPLLIIHKDCVKGFLTISGNSEVPHKGAGLLRGMP